MMLKYNKYNKLHICQASDDSDVKLYFIDLYGSGIRLLRNVNPAVLMQLLPERAAFGRLKRLGHSARRQRDCRGMSWPHMKFIIYNMLNQIIATCHHVSPFYK